MVIFSQLFISISISFQTHSFKQYFQNLEPENPRTKIEKCCQNEQLKFINTIYNQLNIWNNIQLVKLASPPPLSIANCRLQTTYNQFTIVFPAISLNVHTGIQLDKTGFKGILYRFIPYIRYTI